MNKSKQNLVTALSFLAFIFYMILIMYIFLVILTPVYNVVNFAFAILFEIVGFMILAYFILGSIFLRQVKVGYIVPLVLLTIFYTAVLDVINIVFVVTMPSAFFVFWNLVLLFVYCLIAIPMYVMSKN